MIVPRGHRRRTGSARRQPAAVAVLVAVLIAVVPVAASCGLIPGRFDPGDVVYRVEVEQCGGRDTQRATAAAVGPNLLATVAHSFTDVRSVMVRSPDGQLHPAALVHVDPERDIALLTVDTEVDPILELVEPRPRGPVTIPTYADSDGPVIKRGEILDLVTATLDGEGRRAAVKLSAEIEPGDSGAPVVDGGRMVAMIFASARADSVGWAVSSVELTELIEATDGNRSEALPPTCAS